MIKDKGSRKRQKGNLSNKEGVQLRDNIHGPFQRRHAFESQQSGSFVR